MFNFQPVIPELKPFREKKDDDCIKATVAEDEVYPYFVRTYPIQALMPGKSRASWPDSDIQVHHYSIV